MFRISAISAIFLATSSFAAVPHEHMMDISILNPADTAIKLTTNGATQPKGFNDAVFAYLGAGDTGDTSGLNDPICNQKRYGSACLNNAMLNGKLDLAAACLKFVAWNKNSGFAADVPDCSATFGQPTVDAIIRHADANLPAKADEINFMADVMLGAALVSIGAKPDGFSDASSFAASTPPDTQNSAGLTCDTPQGANCGIDNGLLRPVATLAEVTTVAGKVKANAAFSKLTGTPSQLFQDSGKKPAGTATTLTQAQKDSLINSQAFQDRLKLLTQAPTGFDESKFKAGQFNLSTDSIVNGGGGGGAAGAAGAAGAGVGAAKTNVKTCPAKNSNNIQQSSSSTPTSSASPTTGKSGANAAASGTTGASDATTGSGSTGGTNPGDVVFNPTFAKTKITLNNTDLVVVSSDPKRRFQVAADTFVNFGAASQRTCDKFNNLCFDEVNAKQTTAFTTSDCDTDHTDCLTQASSIKTSVQSVQRRSLFRLDI